MTYTTRIFKVIFRYGYRFNYNLTEEAGETIYYALCKYCDTSLRSKSLKTLIANMIFHLHACKHKPISMLDDER